MNTDVEFTESNQIKPMSGMAVTAFVMTILFCIPVLPLVGLLLGLAALGRTSTDGPFRGRPLAIIAIILGLLFTVGQTYTTVKFVEFGGMVAGSIMIVMTGPDDAMEGAFKGDSKQTNDWWAVGQEPSAAQTAAFVVEARRRFGEFKSAVPDDGGQPPVGQASFIIPYKFVFSNGEYGGTVSFQAFTGDGGGLPENGLLLGIVKIIVVDTDGTNVVWEAADAGATAPAGSSRKAPEETVEETE
ncbi:MAG: hypothetical protein P8J59_12090 [Phycisphaerales bacterium]|nr:hypothetical protein [Phycisphaerales bacterium]